MTLAPVAADPLALLRKYDRPVPRYTSYPTAAAFHDGVSPAVAVCACAVLPPCLLVLRL